MCVRRGDLYNLYVFVFCYIYMYYLYCFVSIECRGIYNVWKFRKLLGNCKGKYVVEVVGFSGALIECVGIKKRYGNS